ncbi:hypothetical protein DSO57_1005548 [Entomophthora muscae]|uniref:Uncharacterized protein n=1 Tax=Entomophthora muscae TaxID=34485 RepID=A0ACC2TIV9_9FUNG|nr:hypothetical protein DSO57_1005548 [Entomophthora muscae]
MPQPPPTRPSRIPNPSLASDAENGSPEETAHSSGFRNIFPAIKKAPRLSTTTG